MKNENLLSQFEIDLIGYILINEEPDLINHIDCISVDIRKNTGAGIYVYFTYKTEPKSIQNRSFTLGKTVLIEFEKIDTRAGCILYIEIGKISMLECFCHGNGDWPTEFNNYKFQQL